MCVKWVFTEVYFAAVMKHNQVLRQDAKITVEEILGFFPKGQ